MDPTSVGPVITWLASLLPPPWSGYFLTTAGALLTAVFVSAWICAHVKPPSAAAPKWCRTLYRMISALAGNRGWAANAVVPGMPAIVQQAALVSAKLAAAAPELTIVAQQPAVLGSIVPAAVQQGA